jgi:hypothetical protein
MDVCIRLFCVCAGSDHATGWSPVQAVLPTVYRINWKIGQGPTNGCRAVIMWRVWGLYPYPSRVSYTSVICSGSSDTNLSRVRVSVTSN